MPRGGGPRPRVVWMVLGGGASGPGGAATLVGRGPPPTGHRLWARAPHTLLDASGLPVGLPAGQIGNSEVGHLNLGAGRVVPQDIVRISQAIESGEFFVLPALVELCRGVKRRGGTLHLIGLFGNGGVHALDQHLVAAIALGHQHELPVAIHAWLDGRDTPPQSALGFMQELLEGIGGRGSGAGDGGVRPLTPDPRSPVISTVIGRYYAMDRDKRWERTQIAYDAMVHGAGVHGPHPVAANPAAEAAGETDEF